MLTSNRRGQSSTTSRSKSDRSDGRSRVVIVGGGITGLAAAHRLLELAPDIDLKILESGNRLGGVLHSERIDDFLVECGPDNFITNLPAATDLCRRIGFADQLISTSTGLRQAFVVRRGKLRHLPDGFLVMAPSKLWPMVTTPILSPLGKLRMAMEYFVATKTDQADESLADFATRRFGREVYERLIQPLVGSIYAANPDQLSLQATLPRFLEMERQHGSLVRGALHQRKQQKQSAAKGSGAPYSLFVAPREGMSSFVEAIARRLPEGIAKFNARVERLKRNPAGGWTLELEGEKHEPLDADAVIVTTPAHRTAQMLVNVDRQLGARLAYIPYSSSAIVSFGFRREQIRHPLDGFGFVVPQTEGRRILSGSFSSIKYAGRAPDGAVLMRAYIGGTTIPELTDLSDEELVTIAAEEMNYLLGIQGPPLIQHLVRHRRAMPQYVLGHGENLRGIEQLTAKLPGLELAGNAYHGVGIPNCIQSGQQAAEEVVATLAKKSQ